MSKPVLQIAWFYSSTHSCTVVGLMYFLLVEYLTPKYMLR